LFNCHFAGDLFGLLLDFMRGTRKEDECFPAVFFADSVNPRKSIGK
jgi:hypothetical protein